MYWWQSVTAEVGYWKRSSERRKLHTFSLTYKQVGFFRFSHIPHVSLHRHRWERSLAIDPTPLDHFLCFWALLKGPAVILLLCHPWSFEPLTFHTWLLIWTVDLPHMDTKIWPVDLPHMDTDLKTLALGSWQVLPWWHLLPAAPELPQMEMRVSRDYRQFMPYFSPGSAPEPVPWCAELQGHQRE